MLTLFLTASIVSAKPTHQNIVLSDSCAQDLHACLSTPSNFLVSRSDLDGDTIGNTLTLIGHDTLYLLISGSGDGNFSSSKHPLEYDTFWAGAGSQMYLEIVNKTEIHQYERSVYEEVEEDEPYRHVKTYVVSSASSKNSCRTNVIIASSDKTKSAAATVHTKFIDTLVNSFDFETDDTSKPVYTNYNNLLTALQSPLREDVTMTGVLNTNDVTGLTKGLFVVVGGSHSNQKILSQRLAVVHKSHPNAYIKSITIPNCIYQ